METQSTLLCIHRDPGQLLHLEENGYRLVTATNGGEGLRLFMSRPVDAVVIEYHLGLLDGAVVASEIKQVRPQVPIVMVCDTLELPEDALRSVDAVVVRIRRSSLSDGHDTFRTKRRMGEPAQGCACAATLQPSRLGPEPQNNHLACTPILTGRWG